MIGQKWTATGGVGAKHGGKGLFAMMLTGCFLYGVGFLGLFTQADSLWGRLSSGLLGVGAISLLPVVYGLCLRRSGSFPRVASCVDAAFSLVGRWAVFSLPLWCYLAERGQEGFVSFTLFSVLVFHGALWYGCFFLSGRG